MSDILFQLVPASFPALALVHFLALLSPGPDFFMVVGHAVRGRLSGTVFICAGIALGNAAYIILSVAGWSAIRHSPTLYRCMELAGAAYLAWMAVMLLCSARRNSGPCVKDAERRLPPGKQLLAGLGSALLNPKNAVFYLTLMTVIIGPEATFAQQVFAGVWMTLLVFLWDAGLAAVISLPGTQKILREKIPLVEGLAGMVLVLLAVSLVVFPFGG